MAKNKKALAVKAPDNDSVNSQIVLAGLEKEAAPLIKKLSGKLIINTAEQLENAAVSMKNLKTLVAIADKKEKGFTKPLEKLKKDVIALFKPFKNNIAAIEAEVKKVMLAYQSGLTNKQIKLEDDFNSGKIKKINTYSSKAADLQFNSSSAKVRKVWRAEITNESKIPREYMTPDMDKIYEDLKAGKTIAGVIWKQEDTIAI